MRHTALSRQKIFDTILQHKWFSGLSEGEIGRIATLAVPRRFARGEVVHCKLDPAAGLYGILAGKVRISSSSAEGREAVFSFMGPGDWFGHIGLIDGLPRTHDIHAVQDSLILFIHHVEFTRLLEEYPPLYKHFALKLCALIRIAFSTLDDGALLTIEARLAKRLVGLADTYGVAHPDGALINLHLPQQELASVLNVSRQTINKKLSEWRTRGWVAIHYGQIVIKDRAHLEGVFAAHNTAPNRQGTNS